MTDSLLKVTAVKHLPQPWLSSAGWDGLLIISPAFITSLICLALAGSLDNTKSVPLWAWVCLVLLVDVAHVYATLFRTYFDGKTFDKNRTLLICIPAVCWITGVILYAVDGLLFWQALAYLAVFHFIRQQFGFMILYSRKDPELFARFRWLDCLFIYIATLYPILFWHTNLPRNFNWFVEGDFIETLPVFIAQGGAILYLVVAALYAIKELMLFRASGFFNVPRNLIQLGTALSWWVGIVALNSDIAFTMTNVLSHGIPYMALIWLYHHHSSEPGSTAPGVLKRASAVAQGIPGDTGWRSDSRHLIERLASAALTSVPAFLAVLWILAYFEEGLWDGLVWREHLAVFMPFSHLPTIVDPVLLALLVPLLALPQSTHYVLDGFIWRVKDRSSSWST